jgi:hypothetical protein
MNRREGFNVGALIIDRWHGGHANDGQCGDEDRTAQAPGEFTSRAWYAAWETCHAVCGGHRVLVSRMVKYISHTVW